MESLFSILGPVAVFRDGSALGVGGLQRRAVLARLLVSANRRVDVAALLEDCWGERVTSGSRVTLASHVSQLRRVIGDERLEGRDHGYLLRVGSRESDAACFAAELETGRELLMTGAAADALAVLEGAAARWRGPALAEFADQSWAVPEAARLEGLHELACEALIDAVIGVGEPERAVVLSEAAVREQPFREHRWVQLMLALYRCGRQGEALRAYQRARTAIVGQLGLEPSLELGAMQAAVLAHDPRLEWRAPARPVSAGHPVPRPLAAGPQAGDAGDMSGLPPRQFPFLGRSFEVLKLSTGLAERRLVTLVGPGGVGKTRMAVETAWQTRYEFGDSPVWVDLAAVQEPAEVFGAVATALNLVPSPNGDVSAGIAASLSGSHRLLVLDNCEHVLEPVCGLVGQLISECPSLTVLATSRRPLGLLRETVWTVGPLDPDASRQLFEHRALQADAMLTFTERDRELIGLICERAERVPLAIEIAATHARTRSLADIAADLPDQFALPLAARLPARQRGLAATIEWSWRLLTRAEQELCGRVAVFPAGWEIAAAHAVSAPAESLSRTAGLVGRLADSSLLAVDRSGPRTRYRMPEAVREFARREAGSAETSDESRQRHCRHYTEVSRELNAAIRAPGPNDVAYRYQLEWDNLRAAVGLALAARDLDAVLTLVHGTSLWALHAMRSEHAEWTTQALQLATELGVCDGSLYLTAAEWAYWSDERERALQLTGQAARLVHDASTQAAAWVRIAYTNTRLDDLKAAAAALTHAERALGRCQDPFSFVSAHSIAHGIIAILDPVRRTDHLQMLCRAAAELDNPLANALVGRAVVSDLLFSGATDRALVELEAAMAAARAAGAAGLHADLTILSLAPLALGNSKLPDELPAIIASLRASGYRQLTNVALETLAMHWACNDRTQLAGLLLGYLQAQGPLYQHPYWVRQRARTLESLRHDPHSTPYLARGAAMNQRQTLDVVLAQLSADNSGPPLAEK